MHIVYVCEYTYIGQMPLLKYLKDHFERGRISFILLVRTTIFIQSLFRVSSHEIRGTRIRICARRLDDAGTRHVQ